MRAAAERRLLRMTTHLRAWSETIPEFREATGGPAGIERIIERAEHVFLPFPPGDLHLEVHPAAAPGAPAVVLVPGIGSHARFLRCGDHRDRCVSDGPSLSRGMGSSTYCV
jgi:hypothetical protein